jgi:CRP-like cAMP-binding protein/uncharacterized protein (DUF2249 family)
LLPVTEIPPSNGTSSDREAHICASFSNLRDGESLNLLYDSEPHALLVQLEERFAESFIWSQRRIGGGSWEVMVRKIAGSGAGEPMARFLERCPILATAAESTRRALGRAAVLRQVVRHRPIALQGVAWPFLGVVRSGRIFAVVSSQEGREQILHECGPFESFGEIMLLDGGDSVARYATVEPAEVVLLPRDEVLRALHDDTKFRAAVSAACARRARALSELLCSHVSKPVIARVASAIARHDTPLSLSQIAAAAGTVKEVVARTLTRLEREGAIRREDGRILILDRPKLIGR